MRLAWFHSRRFRILASVFVALVVAAVAFETSLRHLRPNGMPDFHWGTIGPWNFAPSAVFATGKPLALPFAEEAPSICAFLGQQPPFALEPALDAQGKPSSRTVDLMTRQHLYLFYTVGALWRAFGLSWNVVAVYQASVLALSFLLTYFICRLGAGKLLSLFLTLLVLNKVNLDVLRNIRDLSKVPFCLAVLLLAGIALHKPCSRRRLLGLSCLSGAVAGLGMGFRLDLIVFLGVPFITAVLCPLEIPKRALWYRFAAVLLAVTGFVTASWPVLNTYLSSGSTLNDAVLGMAPPNNRALGLGGTSYQKIGFWGDMYASAKARTHIEVHRAAAPAELKEQQGLLWLLDVARIFPGDMLTRVYASIFTIMGGAFWITPSILLLLGIASRSNRKAWALLALTVFVCGYPAIQFQGRHYDYLVFLPLCGAAWLLNAVIQRAWRLAVQLAKVQRLRSIMGPNLWQSPELRRAVRFALAAGLVILAPLYAARAVQFWEVNALVQAYASVPLQPVKSERVDWKDYVLFRVPSRDTEQQPWRPDTGGIFDESIWAVDILPGGSEPALGLIYESNDPFLNFSRFIDIEPARAVTTQPARHYFPVYESLPTLLPPGDSTDPTQVKWNRFAGIALRKDLADRFVGLHRMVEPYHLPLSLYIEMPGPSHPFRAYRTIRPGRGGFLRNATMNANRATPVHVLSEARSLAASGDTPEAAARLVALLAIDPKNMQAASKLIRVLNSMGPWSWVADTCRSTIDHEPFFLPPYYFLDRLLEDHGGASARIVEWKRLADRSRAPIYPYYFLGRALEDRREPDQAVHAFRAALERAPANLNLRMAVAEALQSTAGGFDAAVREWRNCVESDPRSAPFASRSLRSLAASAAGKGDAVLAVSAYLEAIEISPSQDPLAYEDLLATIERLDNPASVLETCQRLTEVVPTAKRRAADTLVRKAVSCRASADEEYALTLAREAVENDPDSAAARRIAAEALEARGDHAEAIDMYSGLMCSDEATPADCEALERLLIARNDPSLRSAVIDRIARSCPQFASRVKER